MHALLCTGVAFSWVSPLSIRPASTAIFSTPEDNSSDNNFEGKTIFQRTFYRLSSDSQVQLPNAVLIEERLRFLPDPEDPGYMVPVGPRTLIVREGTEDDDITDEIFRMDLPAPTKDGSHSGPRSLDTEIATVLYLASNPNWIQGDVLELSCAGASGASGAVGLLACVAARLATMAPQELEAYKLQREQDAQDVLHKRKESFSAVLPPRLYHLTLTDESPESLKGISEMIHRHFLGTSSARVSVQQLEWSHSRGRRKYDRSYRTILGSDLDLSFPTAKELSKTVANMLLPSNEFAIANMKEPLRSSSSSKSFGAIGIDPEPTSTSENEKDQEVDPSIPATFVHLCPDYRDETRYLRQLLEKGYLMTVRTNYVNMERLQFGIQTLPQGSPESDLDELEELEVQEDSSKDYQSMTAIHSPEYGGEGLGEYFFPIETGAYEGGLSSLDSDRGGPYY